MKKLRCIFFILLPLVCAAQDEQSSAIKVTTTLHEDGSKTVTKLDPDQHTSEATTFNSADKMQQRIVYDLDDQNQATAGKVYAANGTLLLKCVYKRDSSNRVYEEDDYTPDDKLARRFVYEFGPNGKVAHIRAFDGDGTELRQSQGIPDQKKSPPRRRR